MGKREMDAKGIGSGEAEGLEGGVSTSRKREVGEWSADVDERGETMWG